MDSKLTAQAQAQAKALLEEQVAEVGVDEMVVVGLDDNRAVFVGSHPLHVVMTATFNEFGEFDDWTDSTPAEHAEALRILVAHAVSDRAKRVF